MAFETLLGNNLLKDNLTASLRRGHTAHFYLISGPEGSGKHTLARLLSAALMCTGSGRPCMHCSGCRKVLADKHPDLITVDDPEKKTVPVALIRQARDDLFIRPNEGNKKIYLIPRAQDLGVPGQNALLKVLEEPPAYGVFILLADNPEKLLPTVRSRCVELKLLPLEPALLRSQLAAQYPQADPQAIDGAILRSGGYLGQALQLLEQGAALPAQLTALAEGFANRNALLLIGALVPMERWKRDQLIPLLEQFLQILENALTCRVGLQPLSPQAAKIAAARSGLQINEAIGQVRRCIEYAQGNVSVAAICSHLSWVLR